MKEAKVKRVTGKGFKVMSPIEPGKRFEWLSKVINKKGFETGAEVGVHRGRTTGYILRKCPKLKLLYAVDLWDIPPKECSDQYNGWNFNHAKREFDRATSNYKSVKVLRKVSWEAASFVEDNSLDFIFIDADHSYQSVKKDILAWTPKLKDGGMVSGHDTHFPDVLKAIEELIPNWEAAGIDHCWFAKKEDVIL